MLGMTTPTEVSAAQAAAPSSRGRGRGRGGGSAPRASSNTVRPVAKPQAAKIGPTRLLEVEWVKDSILKDSFVLFGGSGLPGDQQWTFHHPIGETRLEDRDWVATPTRDISFLLQRRESEALVAWKRQAELAKRQQVLIDRKGRKIGPDGSTEVWTFDGAPAIQPTIRTCMTAAKAAGAKESEWLSFADSSVQSAEQTFKEALRKQTIPGGWVRRNAKPAHETKGGPLGDHPQKAIPYLYGLSTAGAKDKVVRVAIGIDHTDSPPVDSDDEDIEEEKTPVISSRKSAAPAKETAPETSSSEKKSRSRSRSKTGSAASSSSTGKKKE